MDKDKRIRCVVISGGVFFLCLFMASHIPTVECAIDLSIKLLSLTNLRPGSISCESHIYKTNWSKFCPEEVTRPYSNGRFPPVAITCFPLCKPSILICLGQLRQLLGRTPKYFRWDSSTCDLGEMMAGVDRINYTMVNWTNLDFPMLGNVHNPAVSRIPKLPPGKVFFQIRVNGRYSYGKVEIHEHLVYGVQEITIDDVVKLKFEVTWKCHRNYYGPDCDVFCESRGPRHTSRPQSYKPVIDKQLLRLQSLFKPSGLFTPYTCNKTDGSKICHPGWKGINCEQKFDPCIPSPCKNQGRCYSGITGYDCICPKGFTGQHCHEEVNRCPPKVVETTDRLTTTMQRRPLDIHPFTDGRRGPIVIDVLCHFGTCVNTTYSYKCICNEGFTGPMCETHIKGCDNFPCLNKGGCFDLQMGEYFCNCPLNFTGSHCEDDVDECSEDQNICFYNGICKNTHGSFSCQCFDGFKGDQCQLRTDPCLSQPCQNQGQCEMQGAGSYVCRCPEGIHGIHCEILEFEVCNDIPTPQDYHCYNGGTCRRNLMHKNHYSCDCPLGYVGDHCERDIDECANLKLMYGFACYSGKCVNTPGKYKCDCPSFASGNGCQCVDWVQDYENCLWDAPTAIEWRDRPGVPLALPCDIRLTKSWTINQVIRSMLRKNPMFSRSLENVTVTHTIELTRHHTYREPGYISIIRPRVTIAGVTLSDRELNKLLPNGTAGLEYRHLCQNPVDGLGSWFITYPHGSTTLGPDTGRSGVDLTSTPTPAPQTSPNDSSFVPHTQRSDVNNLTSTPTSASKTSPNDSSSAPDTQRSGVNNETSTPTLASQTSDQIVNESGVIIAVVCTLIGIVVIVVIFILITRRCPTGFQMAPRQSKRFDWLYKRSRVDDHQPSQSQCVKYNAVGSIDDKPIIVEDDMDAQSVDTSMTNPLYNIMANSTKPEDV